jgi:hypothetical protein
LISRALASPPRPHQPFFRKSVDEKTFVSFSVIGGFFSSNRFFEGVFVR